MVKQDNCAGLGGQYCDVVLVRGRINLGKPQGAGAGFLNGEQMGSKWGGMEMRRSVYEQPGTRVDRSCHSKEGSK